LLPLEQKSVCKIAELAHDAKPHGQEVEARDGLETVNMDELRDECSRREDINEYSRNQVRNTHVEDGISAWRPVHDAHLPCGI
jgi:hypothetical protein